MLHKKFQIIFMQIP